MEPEIIDNKEKDFAHNWVSSSRFIFYCQVFIFVALVTGGCYNLYVQRYRGQPKVEVPQNTMYNPKYK